VRWTIHGKLRAIFTVSFPGKGEALSWTDAVKKLVERPFGPMGEVFIDLSYAAKFC
jgi:hypothetical protein